MSLPFLFFKFSDFSNYPKNDLDDLNKNIFLSHLF